MGMDAVHTTLALAVNKKFPVQVGRFSDPALTGDVVIQCARIVQRTNHRSSLTLILPDLTTRPITLFLQSQQGRLSAMTPCFSFIISSC